MFVIAQVNGYRNFCVYHFVCQRLGLRLGVTSLNVMGAGGPCRQTTGVSWAVILRSHGHLVDSPAVPTGRARR
jgi:hypothetical protein